MKFVYYLIFVFFTAISLCVSASEQDIFKEDIKDHLHDRYFSNKDTVSDRSPHGFKYSYYLEDHSLIGKNDFNFFTEYRILIFFENEFFKSFSVFPVNLSGYHGAYFFQVDCDDILKYAKDICDLKNVNNFLNYSNMSELKETKSIKISESVLKVESESNFIKVVEEILKANHYSDQFIESLKKQY